MYDFRSDHLVLDNQRGGVFCSQLFLVACNSLSRIGALWPLHVILSIGLVLVQAAMWLRLRGCGFPDIHETQSHSRLSVSLAVTVFPPPLP